MYIEEINFDDRNPYPHDLYGDALLALRTEYLGGN